MIATIAAILIAGSTLPPISTSEAMAVVRMIDRYGTQSGCVSALEPANYINHLPWIHCTFRRRGEMYFVSYVTDGSKTLIGSVARQPIVDGRPNGLLRTSFHYICREIAECRQRLEREVGSFVAALGRER